MHPTIAKLERNHFKPTTPQVKSGDTVRVHQRIREGNKQRVQVFEGVVIRTHRLGSVSATITVRRIASGVGVEKTYLLHSPNVDRVEIRRRAKVRRNFLSYLRGRRGKSARLHEVSFDKNAANTGLPNQQTDPKDDTNPVDAEITEIDAEEVNDDLNETEVSTEEIAKEENKEARQDDPKSSDGGTDEGDEDVKRNEEFQKGVDRAQPNNE